MNILTKCKGMFPGAKKVGNIVKRDPSFVNFLRDWGRLVRSRDEKTFNSRLISFICDHPKQPVDYCLNTWLYPWKARFVTYLVNLHYHLGYITISIVELLYGQMKRFLWSSKGDFDLIIDRFNDFWLRQIKNIRNLQLIQCYKISTFSIKPIYLPIREQVTAYALSVLEDEHRAVEAKPRKDLLFLSQGCSLNLDKTRNLRRDPSLYEIAIESESLEARVPPSTAPANLETPQVTGLTYIRQFGDTLEPGTQAPRKVQASRYRTPPDESVIVVGEAGPIGQSQDAEHETLTDFDILIIAQQDEVRAEDEEEDSLDNWDDLYQQQETQEEITCDLSDPKFLPQ
ncbi:unnamed protein product [Clonostachys rosea f. rosea IK726]|uniref:Uncharacterized protein n=1 Tax=Clonostachys rosea f. rosea IK726 TaxID=1349383 RepID=A0ACA9UTI7_BIOOC|nr:unnamed protein product [Clonostachys rosea f. rosea IK726]